MGVALLVTTLMLLALAVSAMDVTLVALVLALAMVGVGRSRLLAFVAVIPLVVMGAGLALSAWASPWWEAGGAALGLRDRADGLWHVPSAAPTWLLSMQLVVGVVFLLAAVAAWRHAERVAAGIEKALSSRAAEVVGERLSVGAKWLDTRPLAAVLAGAGLAATSLFDPAFLAAVAVSSQSGAPLWGQCAWWILYALVSTAPVLAAAFWSRALVGAAPARELRGRKLAQVAQVMTPLIAVTGVLCALVLILQVVQVWLR